MGELAPLIQPYIIRRDFSAVHLFTCSAFLDLQATIAWTWVIMFFCFRFMMHHSSFVLFCLFCQSPIIFGKRLLISEFSRLLIIAAEHQDIPLTASFLW